MTTMVSFDNDWTVFFTRPDQRRDPGAGGRRPRLAARGGRLGALRVLPEANPVDRPRHAEARIAGVGEPSPRWSRARAPRRPSPTATTRRASTSWSPPPAGRSSSRRATARWPSSRCATPASATSTTRSRKNHRKTLGPAARPAGREDGRRDRRGPGARHRRDRAARSAWCAPITPSTNPRRDAGQQDHQRAEGPQRGHRRAVAQGRVAPARGCSSSSTRSSTASARRATWCRCCRRRSPRRRPHELMRQCDLVVATGSQANVRAAYASGTPAFGVGAGNVAAHRRRDRRPRRRGARRSSRSKTFDNATSCSSENSVVIVERGRTSAMLAALGAARRRAARRRREGAAAGARCGPTASCRRRSRRSRRGAIAERAGLDATPAARTARVLHGRGERRRPRPSVLRREALARCWRVYRARDFDARAATSSRASTPTRAPATRCRCTARDDERALRARPRRCRWRA